MYDDWDSTRAQRELDTLYWGLGTWDAVAAALAPHLVLSRASWWYAAPGQYITPAKIAALRAYTGTPAPPAHVARKHPNHKSLNIRRSTWEYANAERKRECLTWNEMLRGWLDLPP